MRYPGRVIKMGESDAAVVRALKAQLNKALTLAGEDKLKLDESNAMFGPKVKQAVQMFQARHGDSEGRPLKPDGEVGAITWAALFGDSKVANVSKPANKFLGEALDVALAEEAKKIREVPPNSNRGPAVEAYLASVGLGKGHPWCCAFTYWCFEQAAQARGRANPMVRTGGCLAHWNGVAAKGAKRITKGEALADPALVKPGMVFIMDFGGGKGHTGFVVAVRGGLVDTVEGNTDASKSREGGGVYRLTRKLLDINKGYIDYSGVA